MMRASLVLPGFLAFLVLNCGSDPTGGEGTGGKTGNTGGSSGGSTGSGGNGTGGSSTGGTSTGGTTNTGGSSTGGKSTGGAGGSNAGGQSTGGSAGGTSTGGKGGGAAGGSGGKGSGGNGAGGSNTGGSSTGGSGGGGNDACANFEAIVSKAQFDQIFPLGQRNAFYTYEGMVEAIKKYPTFATTGDCATRKREVAAIFANITRETACLKYIEQIDKSSSYCDKSKSYGCPAGEKQYYGRGPIQLSWNYNYNEAGIELKRDLLNMPQLVATDATVAWETALWFWNKGGNCHAAITSGKGFGATINIVNGREECNGGTKDYARAAVTQRVCAYQKYVALLGTDVGPGDLNCNTPVGACPSNVCNSP